MSLSPRRSLIDALLVATLGLAVIPGPVLRAAMPKPGPEPRRRRGSIFRSSTSFSAKPGCGNRECARRRKQIIAGTLLTSARADYFRAAREAAKRLGSAAVIGWDLATGPDETVTIHHQPRRHGKSTAAQRLQAEAGVPR